MNCLFDCFALCKPSSPFEMTVDEGASWLSRSAPIIDILVVEERNVDVVLQLALH